MVKNLDFFRSAVELESTHISTGEVLAWIQDQNHKVHVNIEHKPLKSLNSWNFNDGMIQHKSGHFFSIIGYGIEYSDSLEKRMWDQPLINQPEIGILGFLVKKINGIYHFLVQAKIEPGNVNNVQLSPTLQATKSNYSRIHNGLSPKYLEFFINADRKSVIIDQLQSEQGSRFLKKKNRNIIVEVTGDIKIEENYIWLTLGQIKHLMSIDNVINMDSRTVLSHLLSTIDMTISKETFGLNTSILNSFRTDNEYANLGQIHSFLNAAKSNTSLKISKKKLTDLKNWMINNEEIYHVDRKFFSVVGVTVTIENREVKSWDQPMIKPASEGLCILFCKVINGKMHLLVHRKFECGFTDLYELGPTIQTSSSLNEINFDIVPFANYFKKSGQNKIIFDTKQSEEGGRFYREENRNILVLNEHIPTEINDANFIWVTLAQLNHFIQFSNQVNIQLRNMFSQIPLKHKYYV